MDLEQFIQTVNLNDATLAILHETQKITGKPFIFIHNPEIPVQACVKIARSSMSDHIITYAGTDSSLLSHQIAHECGHILRYYSAPTQFRLMPVSDGRTNQAAISAIEKDDKVLLKSLPIEIRYQIIHVWVQGLIQQVTSIPPDIFIERWLFENYPLLRDDQRRSLEQTHRKAIMGLDPALRSRFPRIIIDSSIAMNYAYYKKIDDITDFRFFEYFKRAPIRKTGEKLFGCIKNEDKGLIGDIALINEWAGILQIGDWFKWDDFENIPRGYENQSFVK